MEIEKNLDINTATSLLISGPDGIGKWNELREKVLFPNLSGIELPKADLTNADLSNCILYAANLSGAILHNADLSGALLDRADLTNANIVGAFLEETSLAFADMRGAVLKFDELSGSKMSGVNLAGSDLSNQNIAGINLELSNLSNSNFEGSNLSNANLSKCYMVKSNLIGANLEHTFLEQTILTYANLTGAKCRKALFFEAVLSHSDLKFTDLTEANFTKANLSNSNLQDANLQNATLDGAKMTHAVLNGANCNGASFNETKMHNAILLGVRFKGAVLGTADLQNAQFEDIDISDAYSIPPELLIQKSLNPSNGKKIYPEGKAKVVIYLPNVDYVNDLYKIDAIRDAVDKFMEAFEFELEPEIDPVFIIGSWYTELWYRSKKLVSKAKLKKVFNSMRDLLVGVAVDSANVDILQRRTTATDSLLKQIEPFDEVVIRLGGIIVVKTNIDGKTHLLIETISSQLAKKLDEKPSLIKQPQELFFLLQDETTKLTSQVPPDDDLELDTIAE